MESNAFFNIGCGQAIFDNDINPQKRYFLEKRWSEGDNVLSVIMTNPSKADSMKSDDTVNFLIDYAKHHSFDALYVVNIIPFFSTNVEKLKKQYDNLSLSNSAVEVANIESLKYVLKNSNCIIIAWGEFGQKYFENIILRNEVKNLFLNKIDNCNVFGFGVNEKFPKHPRPNNKNRMAFTIDSELQNASLQLIRWINN